MCTKCDEEVITSNCGCTEPEVCACENPISEKCIVFTGETLPTTNIVAGDTGDVIFQKLEDAITVVNTLMEECCASNSGSLNCDLLTP